jgi:acyl-CoA synthetase (AMP-forming)/AMP-acid ligase II
VLRTAASWAESFPAVTELTGLDEGSRVWVPGPVTSTMNLFAVVHAHHTGATLVDDILEATHAVLTPTALSRLVASGPVPPMTVVVAGDRLGPALHDRCVDAGLTVHHYYGAAELSFVAWGSHADDLRPFPGVEVLGEDGVLWVRSPFVCEGYDGAAGPLERRPDGFSTVGDLGEVRDGHVVVHGRPEAVTTGSATVLVADVEAALAGVGGGDVVVLGIPHADLGSVLAAVLTDPADLAAVRDRAREVLTTAARPRVWLSCPEPPQTAAGKLDREALRRAATGGELARLT